MYGESHLPRLVLLFLIFSKCTSEISWFEVTDTPAWFEGTITRLQGEFCLKDYEFEESTFMGGWITNHNVIDDMWSYFIQNESSHEEGKTIAG